MLGLADRIQVFDLLDAVMRGDVKTALDLLANQYASGADPLVVVQDMLELTHWLTRLKVAPDGADDALVAEAERTRGKDMAEALSMPVLTRTWQMLLKGLSEARSAPMPLQAVEMTLVRLAYAADLPTPEDAVKAALSGQSQTASRPTPPPRPTGGNGASAAVSHGSAAQAVSSQPAAAADPAPAPTAEAVPVPQSLTEVVALCEAHGEIQLASQLERSVHLVRFETGRIEIHPKENTPQDVAGKLGAFLNKNTSERWMVSVSNQPGDPTLHEQEVAAAASDPFVKSLLEAFPGAEIQAVRQVTSDD